MHPLFGHPGGMKARLTRIEEKIDEITKRLDGLVREERQMDQALQDALTQLAADVTANTDGINSGKQALAGLAAKVDDLAAQLANGVDPAAVASQLQAFSASLKADDAGLADAIVANTRP